MADLLSSFYGEVEQSARFPIYKRSDFTEVLLAAFDLEDLAKLSISPYHKKCVFQAIDRLRKKNEYFLVLYNLLLERPHAATRLSRGLWKLKNVLTRTGCTPREATAASLALSWFDDSFAVLEQARGVLPFAAFHRNLKETVLREVKFAYKTRGPL